MLLLKFLRQLRTRFWSLGATVFSSIRVVGNALRLRLEYHRDDWGPLYIAMMVLTELTKEIKPLTRLEKLQLIETISKMLLEEESPGSYVDTSVTYPLFTPLDQEKAAAQLQQFLNQQPR